MAKNVSLSYSKDGKKLIVEVDLTQEFGRSSTGKTIIVASTEGNMPVQSPDGGEMKLGLNVFKK